MADEMRSCENQDCSDDCLGETCIFCTIAKGEDPNTEILAEDEDIVCFQDIYPGTPHNFLVVPKKHIYSCLSLNADEVSLVRRMVEMGKDVLKTKNVTDLKDISLGFHVPPYITVPHLHLHVLAPFSQLFQWSRFKYISFWYLTADTLIKKLTKNEKTDDQKCTYNKCEAI